ncbi:TetR family transcriptional regulator [Frankia sp. CNm7]|uniref:TetR family transcriptional regulator n=1 Tax=Frankia nepalensis TaxID=1836974 RepID=A0A937UQT3_9ACTN|nr:TetR family transcriptional regulator [Frankia nepalensis]MBL7502059.1 TetR family transcriptional regulator [Frankia nepalensis]MBL7511965.1 TetR family transcriptional regulator [Frankia nepalensis]MBL7524045.1 TetR family transcriptional regulator [Frankia nepalensis]MBL7630557.1 TetR family transcriptional regulator [Frankia nepalensis]
MAEPTEALTLVTGDDAHRRMHQARLDEALGRLLGREVIDAAALTVEGIAREAGVGRATAYRYLGDRNGLASHVIVILARRHAAGVATAMAGSSHAVGKLEEGWAYGARELPRIRSALNALRESWFDDAVRMMLADVTIPILRDGQDLGQIRRDVPVDEITEWLESQTRLLLTWTFDEAAARRWFRRFVAPGLRPAPEGGALSVELTTALDTAQQQLLSLARTLDELRHTPPEA